MKSKKILTSIIAVLIGFIIGGILTLLIGSFGTANVGFFTFFQKFIEATFGGIFTGDLYNFGEWLMTSTLLILTGLSVAFSYRANIFNIGAEGQFVVGSFVSTIVGIYAPLPPGIHAIVALFAGILAGALYGLIPGILKAYYNVSEVVITIMLNWIAVYYTQYLTSNVFMGDAANHTPKIQESASLTSDKLSILFDGARIHYGFIVAILGIIIYYVILNKTTYGYELKAVGFNIDAANYAGMKSKRKIMSTLAISGAFAGAAGAVFALGAVDFFTATTIFRNYGFDGITVAFLGQMSPGGMALSALLLGGFRATGRIFIEVPSEIIDIIIGVILVCSVLIPIVANRMFKGGKK